MKRVAFRWLLVLILCLTLLPTVVLAETDDITPIEPDKDENGVTKSATRTSYTGLLKLSTICKTRIAGIPTPTRC